MKVLLISGKAQNGKDTTAEFLREELEHADKRVLVTHYADLLKFICRNYFGWDGKKDENGRKLLQYVGTDVIRKKHPSLWVDFVALMLDCFRDKWDFVIIPDVRFPNEIDTIKENSFDAVHIRITRPNFDNGLTEEQKKHPSETALDDVVPDIPIRNNGTLDDLKDVVGRLAIRLLSENPA